MSDIPNSAPSPAPNDGVSMRKQRPAAPTAAATPRVPIPRTIDLAVLAMAVEAVFTLVQALSLRFMSTSRLAQWEIYLNDHAGKSKKASYSLADATHDANQLRHGTLLEAVVLAAVLAAIAVSLRRVRGASVARWVLLLFIVLFAHAPFMVYPSPGPLPMLPKASGVIVGASSIVAIVAVFLPQSMAYFRACRAAQRPAGAPERPGLGALFGSRGAAAQRGMASGRAAAQRAADANSAAQTGEAANPARAKAKAKVRTDADAVAKGAELARSRAKASKSRRADS